jgi:CRISPR system Cascade subunit CasC
MSTIIEIHVIQNHCPANLNRDDLGAPKTCYFGGVLRSRISSQCLKRSIRMSEEFQHLRGGIRTRQLANQIMDKIEGNLETRKQVEKILDLCGLKPKKVKSSSEEDSGNSEISKMLVYTTEEAIEEMAKLLQNPGVKTNVQLAEEFGKLITEKVVAPDMALCGRMLETGVLTNTTVEASLQVAHAISTHEARPEVDYFVTADDIPGEDAGAGYLDETMFSSACFYKYFSINWDLLVENLKGNKDLAAHTVGAFIRGAAMVTPTGKQNSFAAHNRPDGILINITNSPISYANAFAKPVIKGERDLIEQSIAQFGQYAHDMDNGYGKPETQIWFSPNLRYPLNYTEDKQEKILANNNLGSLNDLISTVIKSIGFDWKTVQQEVVR